MNARAAATLRRRAEGLLAAALAGGLLVLALRLEPDPAGVGTHRQLGLPPCTFLTLTGRPCPGCGVTTAFTLAAHGRWLEALRTQPTGLVAALLAGFLGLLGLAEGLHPRGRVERVLRFLGRTEVLLLLAAIGVGGWLWKLTSWPPAPRGAAPAASALDSTAGPHRFLGSPGAGAGQSGRPALDGPSPTE